MRFTIHAMLSSVKSHAPTTVHDMSHKFTLRYTYDLSKSPLCKYVEAFSIVWPGSDLAFPRKFAFWSVVHGKVL